MSPEQSIRILFLAQLPPPFHGQSAMAATLYQHFASLPGAAIDRRWRGGARHNGDVGSRSLRKYAGFARLLGELFGLILRRRSYEIAYLGMVPWAHTVWRDALLVFLATRLASRTLVHVHGEGLAAMVERPDMRRRLMRRLMSGSQIIAITGETARVAEHSGVFSGVTELPNLAPDPGESARAFDGVLSVTCLGNLDPRKGVLDFVEAIGVLASRGVRLRARILGGPTAALSVEAMKRKVEERGLGALITVTGRISDEEKSAALADTDVFLYLSRHDLAPLALIEALAHGCAPIVLRVGGIPEMVGPALAHTVLNPSLRNGDLATVAADAMASYAADPRLLREDRARARVRFLEQYAPERFRQRFLALMRDDAPSRASQPAAHAPLPEPGR